MACGVLREISRCKLLTDPSPMFLPPSPAPSYTPQDAEKQMNRQMAKHRRDSYLYAMRLEQEAQNARFKMSLNTAEMQERKLRNETLSREVQQLGDLLERLGMANRIDLFRRKGVGYNRVKAMTAREIMLLGMPGRDALKLANALAYATAVRTSYQSMRKSPARETTGLYSPFTVQHSDLSLASPQDSVQGQGRQYPASSRRLSALGHDLLQVFNQVTLEPHSHGSLRAGTFLGDSAW